MKSILVVDEQQSSRCYCRTLEDDGYGVRCVSDTFLAMREIAARRPGLVIVGRVSPGLSGMELVMMIKSSHPGLPVIMYTDCEVYKRSYMAWSADECLIKSDDIYPLVEAAHRLLSKPKRSAAVDRQCDTSLLVSLRVNTLC